MVFPSRISVLLLRLMGHNIGKNAYISPFSFISSRKIDIGNDSELRFFTFINCNNFKIGNNTIISYGVQIKGDKSFSTGDNCFVGTRSILHCDEDIVMGFYSAIGIKNLIYTHSSFLPSSMGYPVKVEPVFIGDFVWLSMNVSVLAGAKIGSNCIIGPGVIINSLIPDHTIIEQNPTTYRKFNKKNFQNLLKGKTENIFNDIITSFLKSNNFKYELRDNFIEFIYHNKPYKYKLDLNGERFIVNFCDFSDKVITSYDFDNFYCENSNNKLHKDLLFFLRRQYGVTLRTNYDV